MKRVLLPLVAVTTALLLAGCSTTAVSGIPMDSTTTPSVSPTGWPEAMRVSAYETCMRDIADMKQLPASRETMCGCMLTGGEQLLAAELAGTPEGLEMIKGVGGQCARDPKYYGKPAAAPTTKPSERPQTAPPQRIDPDPDRTESPRPEPTRAPEESDPKAGAYGSMDRYETAQRLIAKIWATTSFSGKAKLCATWQTNPDLILSEILTTDDPAVRIGAEQFFDDHC